MREGGGICAKHGLPRDKTLRSWETRAVEDLPHDLENRFNTSMTRALRAFGAKTPIVTTATWGDNRMSSLPALTRAYIIAAILWRCRRA